MLMHIQYGTVPIIFKGTLGILTPTSRCTVSHTTQKYNVIDIKLMVILIRNQYLNIDLTSANSMSKFPKIHHGSCNEAKLKTKKRI
jgi:hypothetical protein